MAVSAVSEEEKYLVLNFVGGPAVSALIGTFKRQNHKSEPEGKKVVHSWDHFRLERLEQRWRLREKDFGPNTCQGPSCMLLSELFNRGVERLHNLLLLLLFNYMILVFI